MKIILSLPPTTNATYKVGNGHMYKSKEAQSWRTESFAKIKENNKHERFDVPVRIEIIFYIGKDRDIDGGIKTVLDVLQETMVLQNDTQVFEILVKKRRDLNNQRSEIYIYPLTGIN